MRIRLHSRHGYRTATRLLSKYVSVALVMAITPGVSSMRWAATLHAFVPQNQFSEPLRQRPKYPAPPDPNLALLRVTVIERYGRYVTGIEKKLFRVSVNGVEKEIKYLSESPRPISVCIVLALTNSITNSEQLKGQKELSSWLESELGYNHEIFTIKAQASDGPIAAISAGVQALEKAKRNDRAILLITDRLIDHSVGDANQLLQQLESNDIRLFALGILSQTGWATSLNAERSPIFMLNTMSSQTGGKAYFSLNGLDVDDFLDRIALQMSHYYIIGYQPSTGATDQEQNVAVKIAPVRTVGRLAVTTHKLESHRP